MNQQCKVCGEPAAGFHFGAFTCEGCKSFFGRSYNNLGSISECKNNGECIINKKNRTACKACRLRKCLIVGMSKSGSRYGRRSNWFKIHCLLQEQQQAAALRSGQGGQQPGNPRDLILDDYHKGLSPESSQADEDNRRRPLPAEFFMPLQFPGFPGFPPPMLPAPHLLFPAGFQQALYPPRVLLKPPTNNNTRFMNNNNDTADESLSKRFFLDAVLKSQQLSPTTNSSSAKSPIVDNDAESIEQEILYSPKPADDVRRPIPITFSPLSVHRINSVSPTQENPIDLSMKSGSLSSDERRATPEDVDVDDDIDEREEDDGGREEIFPTQNNVKRLKLHHTTPLDLTTKV